MTFVAGDAGHIAEHNRLASTAWGAWTGLVAAGGTFGANVADYGAGFRAVQLRRTLDGVEVQMRGLAGATGVIASGATILTIPTGYRPASSEIRVGGTDHAATQQYCRVNVASTGLVTITFAAGLVSGDFVTVSGMAWSTV